MIIERVEASSINGIKKWVFIFGRRKTGKTFLVRNFIEHDEYFFVKKDKGIVSGEADKEIGYETFMEIVKRALSENKTIVVDEFHRLGEDFLEFLHYTEKRGKIILISSTLNLSKKLLGNKSAILGLFAEVPIGLLKLPDVIKTLKKYRLDKKSLLELAVFLREPLAIDYFSPGKDSRATIVDILAGSIKSMPALIGEIFTEEEKSSSSVYEGILKAIGSGHYVSTEISSCLFSKKLIKKDDPSIIQQYLLNLVDFGIIKKIKVYEKNKFVYRHVSPLARLYYYAEEKYNVSERAVNKAEIGRVVDELLPKIIEDSVREFLAELLGLEECVYETKGFDIDVCLLRFKKIDTAAEIKWKAIVGKEEISKAAENLGKTGCKEKFLFVPDKNKVSTEKIKVVDIMDFLSD